MRTLCTEFMRTLCYGSQESGFSYLIMDSISGDG